MATDSEYHKLNLNYDSGKMISKFFYDLEKNCREAQFWEKNKLLFDI